MLVTIVFLSKQKKLKKFTISFLQFICNCLYEARFSHLCLFKPSNQQGFLLTSVKTCQLHKSMSVFAVKERVQVSQMSRHLLGIDGFFAMFFFAKS